MKQKNKAVTTVVGAMTIFGVGFVGAPAWAANAPSSSARADVFSASAVCTGSNAVASYQLYVDGTPVGGSSTMVDAPAGSTVSVTFTAKAGCDPTQFGLAAYNDPVGSANPTYAQVEQQTFANSTTITRSGGQSGTLSLTLPTIADCHYQVDFFTGDVITDFGGNNFYSIQGNNRLINVIHAERPNCVDVEDTVVERTTTTTAAPTTTTTTTAAPTTTQPGDVEPDEQSRPVTPDETPTGNVRPDALAQQNNADETTTTTGATTTTEPDAEVLAENLARTGTESAKLAGIAAALALVGGSLRVAAVAARRRRANNH